MVKAGKRSARSAFFLFSGKAPFQYGGQAVIEGVMMRGPENLAVAIRRPDGSILVEKRPVPAWTRRYRFLGWPFIRGLVALLESLVLGIQLLTYSANVAVEEEGEELGSGEIVLAIILAVAIATAFFVVVPALLGQWSAVRFGPIGQNLLEGGLRFGFFLVYLLAISRLKDIHRLFAYHGAEHKVIHAWEAGAALQAEAASRYSRLHPRCGTSFILLVFILAVLLYSLVSTPSFIARVVTRLALLPVLAGVGYELLKWSGRHAKSRPVQALIAPGLWLQRLTTREPDAAQLQVAIAALQAVLAEPQPKPSRRLRAGWKGR